jgi:hypothetical protein
MNQPSDAAMASLDQHMDEIQPVDMPALGPADGQPGQIDPGTPAVDPRALAAAQPGDVLSAPASPLDESALRTLHDHYREIEPLDMPSVVVPEGQWGKGEWVPMDIEPDGPPGSIDPEPGGSGGNA